MPKNKGLYKHKESACYVKFVSGGVFWCIQILVKKINFQLIDKHIAIKKNKYNALI